MRALKIQEPLSWFAPAILIAIVLSLMNSSLFILVIAVSIIGLIYIFGYKFILGIIIVSYITILSEFVGESRLYFNLISTLFLLILFLREFGLNFSRYPRISRVVWVYLILLFSALIISTIFSGFTYLGFYSLFTTMLFLSIVYLFYGLLKNEENIAVVIYALCISVLIFAVRMLVDLYNLGLQNYFKRTILEGNQELYGSIGYTSLSFFFISTSLLVTFLIIKKVNTDKINKIYYLLILFHIFALIFTNARALILGSVVSIFYLYLILNTKLIFKVLLTLIIMFIFTFSLFPSLFEIFEIYVRLDTINQREIFLNSGIAVISDYPIFGVGPRGFPDYFFSYAPSHMFVFFELEIWRSGIPNPHNFFLYHWAENGIGGLIISVGFFLMFFYLANDTRKRVKDINQIYYIWVVSITGIGLGMLIRAFFEVTGVFTYGFITFDLPFWLAICILLNIREKVMDQMSTQPTQSIKIKLKDFE